MLLAELDENKEAIRHYIPGNAYIGVDNSYYLTDEQGSVRYVLSADADANVQNIYQYDAFGENVARDERIPNRLKYNAQIEDDLTGLYYLRARYYNTGIGRFTQEDVIYNDGLNLYAYCSSNPVMYADPSGYAGESVKQKTCGSKESGSTSNTGVGNPVKVEGRGSTGRTIPNNLEEQMAMHQVRSDPLEGATELPIKLNDTRWKSSDGWVKMQSVVKTADGNKITIHYVYNKVTGTFDDFKFKLK